MERIDIYATHQFKTYKLRPGRPYPFGAIHVSGGVNFSVFSRHANFCTLVLFERGKDVPLVEIPFRGMFTHAETGEPFWGDFRIGNVFCMTVFGLDVENIEYGYRMDGDFPHVAKGEPGFNRFSFDNILLDPYARAVGGREVWGKPPDWENVFPHRGRLVMDDFDWGEDRPLENKLEDLVVYEMHVRGFTAHPSSGAKFAGTFSAIREKIPYLKELGVNCIELLPIYEFDEFDGSRIHPQTGERLLNYWGYSTINFFSPKAGFAATGKTRDGTMVVDELKTAIKTLHQNGIEVILDVVFNHTAEGNEFGPTISFRGIDNVTYYMLTPEGYYYNFSGTGNTLNCNNPVVRNMVIDCLRYWASEYHIDGFRFDLAAILGRDQSGAPLSNPPLLESLAYDPVLAKCKLIAEAWDAGGLYQVGSFPSYGRWTEWNGKYRDTLRRFIKSEDGMVAELAKRIAGSPDLYRGRGTSASINFITCHDGFTLMDMVSYNEKHNLDNGENNQDGANDNNSWNCGWEGPTDDPGINATRHRQIKNAAALLLTSQGVPMILMGDEIGRTQKGNNNTYCHDNELNWMDWGLVQTNADLFRFFKACIQFRHAHPVLRRSDHFQYYDTSGWGYPDISFHGTQAWHPDWSDNSRILAFLLCSKQTPDDFIYVASSSYWEGLEVEIPKLPEGKSWRVFANTGMAAPADAWEVGKEPVLEDQEHFLMGPRSTIILVGR